MGTTGKKIRKLRKEKGISQEELAFNLGVARQTVSNWEIDAKVPTTDNIIALSDFFNVPPDHILKLKNNLICNTQIKEIAVTQDSLDSVKVNSSQISTKSDKRNSKKRTILHALLLIALLSTAIISMIVGFIIIFVLSQPTQGITSTQSIDFDWVGIFCFCLAIVAIVASIVTICFLIKKKKSLKQSFNDKMQSEDGRQINSDDI